MRLVGVSILALAVVLAFPNPSSAQTKTARGTVSAIAGDTITVNAGGTEMKFTADAKTTITAEGAGTKARAATTAGQAGPKLTDVLKTGQAVIVTYTEMGGMLHASQVQVVGSAGSGGGGVSAEKPSTKNTDGVVKAVSASSLTVTSGGKDMTFAIDQSTRVVGTGASTKTQAAGGRIVFTDLVAAGNRVSVSYTEAAGAMKATEVRVTAAK